jgi:hypothetical protein
VFECRKFFVCWVSRARFGVLVFEGSNVQSASDWVGFQVLENLVVMLVFALSFVFLLCTRGIFRAEFGSFMGLTIGVPWT